jgi:ketosteroid isomerase-like protein
VRAQITDAGAGSKRNLQPTRSYRHPPEPLALGHAKRDTGHVVSKQNIEFVSELWSAVDERGLEAALQLTDPDVQWRFHRAEGRVLSSGELLDFLRAFQGERQLVDATAYTIDDYGDLVLASGSFRLTGSQGMSEFQIHLVYRFSDGKLVRADSYPSRKEARDAMGLPDEDQRTEQGVESAG